MGNAACSARTVRRASQSGLNPVAWEASGLLLLLLCLLCRSEVHLIGGGRKVGHGGRIGKTKRAASPRPAFDGTRTRDALCLRRRVVVVVAVVAAAAAAAATTQCEQW